MTHDAKRIHALRGLEALDQPPGRFFGFGLRNFLPHMKETGSPLYPSKRLKTDIPGSCVSTPMVSKQVRMLRGNCVEVLKAISADSIDSIITDPPYELGFMGKAWDNTGIANSVEMWRECLRVLKPGGYLLSFGGSRTYHRMACAIEDAGFEIRDQIQWIYGSGFPKSLDVSKAIDKAGNRAENWFGPWLRVERERIGMTATQLAEIGGFYKNVNHGGLVVNWELGYGLPSATEFNKVCGLLNAPFARIEELEREVIGQRKVHKGLAFTSEGKDVLDVTAPATDAAKQWEGWGTALKPAHEPIVVARKPLEGTVAANVVKWGTGAINVDGCRIEYASDYDRKHQEDICRGQANATNGKMFASTTKTVASSETPTGRWPANVIHDGSDEVRECFPDAPGQLANVSQSAPSSRSKNVYGKMSRSGEATAEKRYTNEGGTNFAMKPGQRRIDMGSAARFFYCAKAPKKERSLGLPEGISNTHPTVKPLALMRYLCRLVTPPGGTILDPFTGSGSTGIAALQEGFGFFGIEQDQDSFDTAAIRVHAIRLDLQEKPAA